jgi:pyruvate/2-oxoglutarate dehydrogenase complex dihydrolipoamide acyltransferase (E2) component
VTEKQTEALARLNRGIQESRQEVQQRTMNLAKEYFGDSAEVLKQQIKENRATLKDLPDQIPGGGEEAFQMLFQELMDNYSAMEDRISEAQQNVANLDTDQIRRQGEIEATDAARRQARELGVDLTKIEGTGTDGRIIVVDVVEAAEAMGDGAGEEESEVSEDGAAGEAAQGAQDAAGQAVQQVQDAAGGATQQAQDTAGQAVGQAQQAAGQATDQVGQVAGQAQDTAGQVTGQAGQAVRGVQDTVGGLTGGQQGGGGGPLGGVTDQVGQVAGQAQQAAGQVTDQAGQVAGQAQDVAGGAAQQAQDTAGQAAQQGQQAVGQAAQQAGGGQEPRATNAARRRAQEMGIDLSTVEGTGSGGLITINDVVGS